MPAPEPENTEILRQVRAWLQQARQVTVLTGAGVSAESGVPTFRDVQTGIWAQFDPQEMASEPGFRAHPQRVWQWYAHGGTWGLRCSRMPRTGRWRSLLATTRASCSW